MEKYYCDHCRTLYDSVSVCQNCGNTVTKKIWIEVQAQPEEKGLQND